MMSWPLLLGEERPAGLVGLAMPGSRTGAAQQRQRTSTTRSHRGGSARKVGRPPGLWPRLASGPAAASGPRLGLVPAGIQPPLLIPRPWLERGLRLVPRSVRQENLEFGSCRNILIDISLS